MANSEDPDQLASSETNWSGSALFAKAGYILVQKDKGQVMRDRRRLIIDKIDKKSQTFLIIPIRTFLHCQY